MSNLDLEQLKLFIKEEKLDEAKKMIETYVNETELTEAEKGGIYVNLASIYMDFMNQVNGGYEKSLDEIAGVLDKLDKQEGELNDVENIASVREQIKKAK